MTENELKNALHRAIDTGVFPPSGRQEILERMNGGKPIMKRKLSVAFVCVIVLTLAACTALAASLLNRNVLEVFVDDVSQSTSKYIQKNLASEKFEHCVVEVKEAAYDGMSLYILYSIRDRNATELLGKISEKTGQRVLDSETFPAMEEDQVGWWYDGLWIDGKFVNIPSDTIFDIVAGENPGEMLFYQMYRLDRDNIFLSGEQVEIALPIGKAQPFDTLTRDVDGNALVPAEGVLTFTLNAQNGLNSTFTEQPQFTPTAVETVTASTQRADYTPLQTYITLALEVNPAAKAAFIQEHGEGATDENGQIIYYYDDLFVFDGWLMSLNLVDENGQVIFPNVSHALNSHGNTFAQFIYPTLETIPEKLYLAPVTDGQANMAEAVRVR